MCTDLKAAVEVQTPKSARAARLQTLAGDIVASAEVKMCQIGAIGEYLVDKGVVDVPARIEYERV